MPGKEPVDSVPWFSGPLVQNRLIRWEDFVENLQQRTHSGGLSDSQKQKLTQWAFTTGMPTVSKCKDW